VVRKYKAVAIAPEIDAPLKHRIGVGRV
jgi:hypothetical protein